MKTPPIVSLGRSNRQFASFYSSGSEKIVEKRNQECYNIIAIIEKYSFYNYHESLFILKSNYSIMVSYLARIELGDVSYANEYSVFNTT